MELSSATYRSDMDWSMSSSTSSSSSFTSGGCWSLSAGLRVGAVEGFSREGEDGLEEELLLLCSCGWLSSPLRPLWPKRAEGVEGKSSCVFHIEDKEYVN